MTRLRDFIAPNLIADREQFDLFTSTVLPKLRDGEVYFISLSFRKKYLTLKEREYYELGRTEMFARTLVRDASSWEFYMDKMASNLTYRRTKSGLEYPDKAMVVYVNINPSNLILASQKFNMKVAQITYEITKSYMYGSGNPNLKSLDKADRLFMNMVQKETGYKTWLDIDVDSTDWVHTSMVKMALEENGIRHHVIQTKSGYHILVHRQSLEDSKYTELHKHVKKVHEIIAPEGGECIFNKNAMIPMVGTMQSDHLVRMVY